MLYNYHSIVCGVDYMETIFILIIITLVFSVSIGLIIINRDDDPELIIEEFNDPKEKEYKEENKLKKMNLDNDVDVVIANDLDDEII